MTAMMRAANFLAPGRIQFADKPIPGVGSNSALSFRGDLAGICMQEERL